MSSNPHSSSKRNALIKKERERTTIIASHRVDQCTPPLPKNQWVDPKLLESLECIICHNVCASPIYACAENGHLTCAFCHDKCTNMGNSKKQIKCSLCQLPLSVNPFANRLCMKLKIQLNCPHAKSGCKGLFYAATVRQHIKDCEYRPMKCHFECWNNSSHLSETSCSISKETIPMESFADHWTRVHKKSIYSGDACSVLFKLRNNFTKDNLKPHSCWYKGAHYDPTMIHFDGRTFMVNAEIKNKAFHWWILLLGGKKEATRYLCRTKLMSRDNKGAGNTTAVLRSSIVQTIPVLDYYNNSKFDEYCPHYACATAAQVTAASEKIDKPNEATKFIFCLHFEFLKDDCRNTRDKNDNPNRPIFETQGLGKRKKSSSE